MLLKLNKYKILFVKQVCLKIHYEEYTTSNKLNLALFKISLHARRIYELPMAMEDIFAIKLIQ